MAAFQQVYENQGIGCVQATPHGGVPMGDRNVAPGFVPASHSFAEWWDPEDTAVKCRAVTKLGNPCGANRTGETELCHGHWEKVAGMVVDGLIAAGS